MNMDNSQNLQKLFSTQLPFYNCTDYYISYECLSIKNKMLNRLKNNDFTREMIQYVNGFSKDNYTCDYFIEEEFNSLLTKHQKKALKTFHLNIGSFDKNKFELEAYLRSLKCDFQIIGLTELGRTSYEFIEKIFENYDIFFDKPNTTKGGAALLILKNTFNNITSLEFNDLYNFKNKCTCSNCIVESRFVTLECNNNKFTIGCIYRHPKGDINHFNDHYQKIMSEINKNDITILMGDVNIDLLQLNNIKHEKYLNMCLEHNFVPCITLPTRITDHSATLLDHILLRTPTRLIQNKVSAGNLISGLSDHLANFMLFDLNLYSYQDRPKIRLFTEGKEADFLLNMHNEAINLQSQINGNEVNIDYKGFHYNLNVIYNKYFPLVRMSRKQFKHKPYITKGILVSIQHKNKLLKKYISKETKIDELNYKRYKNKLVNIIKKSEENYHRSLISKYNNNNQQLWKCFGNILNKKKIKHNKIGSLEINSTVTTDQQKIVEELNNFFSKIGIKLAQKIDNSENDFREYLGSPQPQSILISKTTVSEVTNIINKLKNSKSPGYDTFNVKFLKLCAPIISPILCNIFNNMVKLGVYPDDLKIAKVVPIFKSGDTNKSTNYRPISILSLINNIFEKILFKSIYDYVEKFNILYQYQYGFRKGHSTTHALVDLVDKIKNSIDNGEMTCGIFVDLSKAFDTVNHSILLHKLDHYGFRGKANQLLESYLTNRKQFVELNNHKSSYKSITCGVPQGSVLGPLLFLIYINDMPNCCPSGNTRIFADDTNVLFKAKNADEISSKGQVIMEQMNKWFMANKLTLNAKKSSFIIFRSTRSKLNNLPERIKFNDSEITRSDSIQYLGLTLDEHLNFNLHIQNVCSSIKRYFKIFYNIRNYINKNQVEVLYYSMIYSRIKYGLIVYGFTSKKNINKLQSLQNQLLKVLTFKKRRHSTNEIHNDLRILKVTDLFFQEKVSFVYNYVNNQLPPTFPNYYTEFAQIHNIQTRNKNNNFIIPHHRTNIGSTTLQINGAKLWNDLDTTVKRSTSIKTFRNNIKNGIIPY